MHCTGVYLAKVSNTSVKMAGSEPGTVRYSCASY